MKKALVLFVLAICLSPTTIKAQFSQSWAAVYDNPSAGPTVGEYARDIVADPFGNSYTAINNGGDIVLVKYAVGGARVWTKTYNGLGNGADIVYSIAIDGSNNIYMTGSTTNAVGNSDLLLLKYDLNGNLLWSRTYAGIGTGTLTDVGFKVCIAPGDAAVFVTGYTNVAVNNENILTLQFDASGNQVWVATHNGSQNLHDQGNDCIADASGNVYVTGNVKHNNAIQNNGIIIKYNSVGTAVWQSILTGTISYADEGVAVVLDATYANVIIGGSAGMTGNSMDVATWKYTAAGVFQWRRTQTGAGSSWSDKGLDVLVDGSGNVYTLGYYNDNGSATNSVMFKYDPLGNLVWGGQVLANAYPIEEEFDLFGNIIFVAGYTTGNRDIAVCSRPPVVGPSNFLVSFSGTPAAWTDGVSAIAVDGSGAVHVAGQAPNSSQQDALTITYDNSGNLWWYDYFGNSFTAAVDIAYDIEIDANNNVYVEGYNDGTTSYDDFITMKYNSAGVLQWATRGNGANNSYDRGKALAVDATGNVYATGYITNSSGYKDYGTFKYNSSGVQQWRVTYSGTSNAADSANAIAVDASGNVYITGMLSNTTSLGDIVTIKYNSAGVSQWIRTYTGTANNNDIGRAIHVDAAGNVYVCGSVQNVGFNNDYAIIKYDAAGTQLWARTYNGTQNLNDYGTALAVDATGNVYVTGNAYNVGAMNDLVTVKYDASGTFQWAMPYNGTANTNDYGTSIDLDPGGNIVVCGTTASTGTADDYVTIKYDPAGAQLWARVYDGPGSGIDNAVSVKTDLAGRVYTTGFALSQAQTLLYDYCSVIYDAAGTVINNLSYSAGSKATCSAVDPNGGLVVAGYSQSEPWKDIHTVVYCTAPTAGAGSNVSICSGGSVTLNASGGTSYSWSPAAGLSSTTIANPVASPTVTTTYTVTVANGACNSTASVTVTVGSALSVTASATPGTICSGGSSTLAATGATTYTWNPGNLSGSSVSVSPTVTTTYTVTGTDGSGCNATATTTITVNDPPPVPGTISGPATICSGSSNTYSITAVPGATSYTWTTPLGWSGTSTTNSITTTANSTSGNITVTADNTCGTSAAQTLAVTVNSTPATPGTISGPATICSGSSNTYSITAVPGATSYTWTSPLGWSGTSTTNSITTTANTTSGNITVTADNTCGTSAAQTLAVTVNSTPATPGTISGPATICSGSSNTYSITAVAGATSYTWTTPLGWSGTSTTNSITTTSSATSGNITVTATNSCGTSSAQTLAVTVNSTPATPGTISGPATICSGSSNTYSITAVAGATSYTWTTPLGWSGTSTTNSITTTANTTSGNITVTADNVCGTSAAQTLTVTVNSIPTTPGTISGPATICSGSSNTYSVTAVAGATSYTWTTPLGWSGTSTTNSITTTAGATSGNITVTADNTCGTSAAQTLAVTVNSIPTTPGTISGPATICPGSSNTYSVTAVAGATSYTWTTPLGWSGTSTTNSITTTANTTSGNITVTADNVCGTSAAQTLAVAVNNMSATTSVISPLCNGGSDGTATVTPAGIGPFTYAWSNSQTTPTATALIAGTYTVVTTGAGGCTDTQTIIITEPSAIVVSLTQVNVSCFGGLNGSIDLTVTGGTGSYAFDWNSGAYTVEDPSGLVAGIYSGIITDVNGCTGSATTTITEPNALVANVVTATNPTTCGGTDGMIDISVNGGTPGYSFLWNNSAASEDLSGLAAGTYSCTITDTNGCITFANANLNDPNAPIVTLALSIDTACQATTAPFVLTGESPAGGTFSGPGVSGGSFDPMSANIGMNMISYTYTDINGCTGSIVDSIFVDICLGVPAPVDGPGFIIFPNPNNGNFTFQSTLTAPADLFIYDALGQLVSAQKVQPKMPQQLILNASGIYLITFISADGHRSSERVIVTK